MRGSCLFALPVQAEHAKGMSDCIAVVVEVLRPSVLKIWTDKAVAFLTGVEPVE
jgi:hypothetical protein